MDGAPWGGCEELWYRSALRMAAAGFPVAASVLKWPAPAAQLGALRRQGIPIVERSVPSIPARAVHRIFPTQKFDWLRKLNPRFVLLSQGSNWSDRTIEAGEALIRLGFPYAIVSHCAYPWHWPDDHGASRMRAIFRHAAAACFVSQANLETTRMQIADPIANAAIVRNPFAVEYSAPLPWPRNDVTQLAFVARLEPGVKGHDLLFQALAAPKWRGRKLNITLYGSGLQAGLIRHLQTKLDLPNVRFAGFAQPGEIWRHHHALILPSRAEGLPIVIVEAMLSGRPCICTAAGGSAEVVADEVTGFVARDITVDGVAEVLERAWNRKHDWKIMGDCAARRIRSMIPADPVGDFVARIERLVADHERKSRAAG